MNAITLSTLLQVSLPMRSIKFDKHNKQFYKFQSPKRLTSSAVFRHSIPDLQSRSHFQCEALNSINAMNSRWSSSYLNPVFYMKTDISRLDPKVALLRQFSTLPRCNSDARLIC
jgi:hypothetical protein